MTIDPKEAGALLGDVAGIERSTREFLLVTRLGDYLLMAGIIWMIGYAASYFSAPHIKAMWLTLNLAAIGGTLAISLHNRKKFGLENASARPALAFAAIIGFIQFWIWMTHMPGRDQDAFGPMVIALFLIVIGLWAGRALALLGVALMALTLAGYFWMGFWFQAWLAGAGGLVLLLASLWARR